MLELIRQIPGPWFLLLYAAIIVGGLLFGRKWVNADDTGDRPLPDFARYDPLSLALLRGGVNEAIRTVVFMLVDKKLIAIDATSGKPVLQVMPGTAAGLGPMERDVYEAIRKGIANPGDLFKSAELRSRLEQKHLPIREEFERARLLRSADERSKAMFKKIVVAGSVLLFGLIKLALGLSHDRPVAFLLIELVIAVIVLLHFVRISPFTNLGQRYLRGLENHFIWMQNELATGIRPAGIDPAMAVAIFGVAALTGFGEFAPVADAFPAKRGAAGDAGAGCGGSSGCSGSSGCGGSDGGGGGCSGGGCGGCGGD